MQFKLGFVGAGNMAEAIARAAIEKNILLPEAIIAADPMEERRRLFSDIGGVVTRDNAEVVAKSQQILLAIKPQALPTIADALAGIDPQSQVVLSIMAGQSTKRIEAMIGKPARVVRVMPNTPLMVGRGMAGVALGQHAHDGDESLVMKLLGAAGKVVLLRESELDAITAVSGSGPAYVFYLAEAMTKAAEQLGLAEHASMLVGQTILGAAELLCQSDEPAGQLRRNGTSPGGTTEAAVRHLDGNKTTEVIVNAIASAHQRSQELGA